MKAIILMGLAVVLLTACETGPPRWTQTSPEVDVVKTLVKDYDEGNWEDWSSHYADTAKVYHNSIDAINPQQLQEALKADIARVTSYGFGDQEMFVEMIIDDDGDKWVYFWGTWDGTVAETNAKLVIPVHLACKFVDGKIVSEYGYYNLAEAAAAFAAQDAARAAATADEQAE